MAVQAWRAFEDEARRYFSKLWGVELQPRTVMVDGVVPWKFDLVSPDLRYVGDVKWLKNISVPAAKWQAIAEYIWLLQKVDADKVFLVFGRDVEVPQRYLKRVGPLTAPVEFYFLDETGHRQLRPTREARQRSRDEIARVGKYGELVMMLREAGTNEVTLSFDQIADRLGGLPKSAYEYAAWWSNNPTGHVHAQAWLQAGYDVAHVNVRGRQVTFRRRRR